MDVAPYIDSYGGNGVYGIFDGKIKIQGKSEDVAVDPVAKEFYLGKDFQL